MTFLYGAGIPILFPISVLSLTVLYVKERLCLAYSYREPKNMLDDSLNQSALSLLSVPPLLYSATAFWMFNNPQIFTNTVYYVQTYSSRMITGHTFSTVMPHTVPVLIAFTIGLAGSVFWRQLTTLLGETTELNKQESYNLYKVLTRKQRNHILSHDSDIFEKEAIQNLEKLSAQRYRPKSGKKQMIGLISYQLLDHPEYQRQFSYRPHEHHEECTDHTASFDKWTQKLSEFTDDVFSAKKAA